MQVKMMRLSGKTVKATIVRSVLPPHCEARHHTTRTAHTRSHCTLRCTTPFHRLQWDTAGQERFRTLTSSYYRGAHGIILVYDITRPDSFHHLSQWLSEIENYSPQGGKNVVKLLVGNKTDLASDRAVSTKDGEAWARSKGMLFLESSAKSADNVKTVFEEVVQKILESPALLATTTAGSRAGITRLDAPKPAAAEAGAGGGGGCCS